MKTIDRSITDIIDTEYLEYSMYVLEQRAIPSVCDGFKNVHRKLVYAMLTEHIGKKVKLADLSGISKFNYHHGESSAAGAAVTLTADWNNNCPVFTGHGNFGSRLVQEAAAPRYIFVTLSPEFKKYFIDTEVAPKSFDEENPEPAHYLPIIPWVIINGISGIAVGFACNILPHSIKSVTALVKLYLKNPQKFLKDQPVIQPTFPYFKGEVAKESDDGLSWSTTGIIEYIGKYTFKISELPVGYDREQYVNILNNLVDADKIKDYEDGCSEDGFGFLVKVSTAQKEKIDLDPIKYFKLRKNHTQNLTTLGVDGKLKIFKSVADLIAYFCDYRLQKFADKIQYEKNELAQNIEILTDKVKFIQMVIDGKVKFKQLTKQQLIDFIRDNVTVKDHGKAFINIPVYNMSLDVLEGLQKMIRENNDSYQALEKITPLTRFMEVLK